jgi:hypothetical protein
MMFQTIIDEKQIVSVFFKVRAVNCIVNLHKKKKSAFCLFFFYFLALFVLFSYL